MFVSVTSTVEASKSLSGRLAVLTDGTVVAIDRWVLIRFDMELGREMHSEELEGQAYDLVEVTLGGKPALAVSYP